MTATIIIPAGIERNERIRRLKHIKSELSSEDKNNMPAILRDRYETKAGYTSICNYLDEKGNSYWTEMAIIMCGENIIKNRAK